MKARRRNWRQDPEVAFSESLKADSLKVHGLIGGADGIVWHLQDKPGSSYVVHLQWDENTIAFRNRGSHERKPENGMGK